MYRKCPTSRLEIRLDVDDLNDALRTDAISLVRARIRQWNGFRAWLPGRIIDEAAVQREELTEAKHEYWLWCIQHGVGYSVPYYFRHDR